MMMREEGNIAQEIKEIINNTKSRRRKNTERSISIRRQIHVYDSIHIAIR